jgi:uncharacterized protein (TIRG00374 family)
MNTIKQHKKTLQFVLFFALTVVLLWFGFKDIQWLELWDGVKSANYWWVIATVLIGIAAYWVRARRWQLLIRPLGYAPSVRNVYRAVVIGYLANFAFPRLGEIARCGTLTKSDAVPFDKLVGTVVTERLFDFLCMLVILAITVLVQLETFGGFLQQLLGEAVAGLNVSMLLIISVLCVSLFCVGLFLLLKYKRDNRIVAKLWRFLNGVKEGLTTFMRMERRGEFLLHTVLLWACYWFMAWLMFYAIAGLSHLGVAAGLITLMLSSFGIIVPTNGGLGSYHSIMKLGLPAMFGVSEADALLYATIEHESQMIFIIILGIVAYKQVFLKRNRPI